jgi:beta-carotene 3-hydroxylase
MVPAQFALLTLAVFLAMEGVAWWTHRYIMHGPLGWGWHRDHHEPHDKRFETNDLYGVVGSVVGVSLFVVAWRTGLWPVYAVALGVTLYGAVYAFVHDGLVHQRWPFRWVPRSGYARRLVQAHRLHHAVRTREGAVSFGFVLAPDPRRLNAVLKARRAERQPGPTHSKQV